MKGSGTIFFRRWYTSIDRRSMFLLILLIVFGMIFSPTATMPFAVKRNMPYLLYAKHHIVMAFLAIVIILITTLLHEEQVKFLMTLGYMLCLCAMLLTFVAGVEIKGARRWIKVFGLSIQPSEFLKPTMSVVSAYFLSKQYDVTSGYLSKSSNQVPLYLRPLSRFFVVRDNSFDRSSGVKKIRNNNIAPYIFLSCVFVFLSVFMLLIQPDFGMALLLIICYFSQLFIAGISLASVFMMLFGSGCFACLSYVFLPHVRSRVDTFLFGDQEASYQISKALQAIRSGGFFGKGAGNGTIKQTIPDMHADFVLSVMSEEFGVISCLVIFTIFLVITTRAMIRVLETKNMFKILIVFGLSIQILAQVFVSFGSSMGIIPTKGITLPFFSYGGSSVLSAAISFGLIMCFTKSAQ